MTDPGPARLQDRGGPTGSVSRSLKMPPFRERVPGLASLIVTVFAGFSLAASANGQSWPTISMSVHAKARATP